MGRITPENKMVATVPTIPFSMYFAEPVNHLHNRIKTIPTSIDLACATPCVSDRWCGRKRPFPEVAVESRP